METQFFQLIFSPLLSPYSLGKLIDWKLEDSVVCSFPLFAPYSLGKLIDWKHKPSQALLESEASPYSLGKLIDWKRPIEQHFENTKLDSLLAREIN